MFELDPFSQPDVETYDECYFGTTQGAAMASPPNLSVVTVDGPQSGLGSDGDAESTLDVEEISGFVPLAKIEVYEGPNTDTGPLDVYNAMITQDTAQVISTSWGSCEAQAGGSAFVAAEANLFEEAAAQGQTVVAAAGDDGSTDCTDQSGNPIGTPAVDDPGSQPYVTSVGGSVDHRPRLAAGRHHPGRAADPDGMEHRRQRRRRRNILRLGDAGLPVGCLARARRDQDVLVEKAVRRPDRLLPRGP